MKMLLYLSTVQFNKYYIQLNIFRYFIGKSLTLEIF